MSGNPVRDLLTQASEGPMLTAACHALTASSRLKARGFERYLCVTQLSANLGLAWDPLRH